MKLNLTYDIPDSPVYYYWTNFGEHTPTILHVELLDKEGSKQFYASNEEFQFWVKPCDLKKAIEKAKKYGCIPVDGHYHGEQMWAKIPDLMLDGKSISPNCY